VQRVKSGKASVLGNPLSSGIYFVQAKQGGGTQFKRMIVMMAR
jgi:hypothetical protein